MACKNFIVDFIVGENQLVAITKRTILHTLPIIQDSTDLSNTLNKTLAVISLDFLNASNRVDLDFIHFALRKFGYRN